MAKTNDNKPSGYALSRAWFDYAFENPDKVTVNQTALFMWLIELNNRMGWALKLSFNTEDAGIACGLKDRKTVWKAMNELVEIGFVTMIFKSSHRHKASVISILDNKILSSGCLDKSINYLSELRTGKGTVSGSVEEQYADQLGNGKGIGKGTVSGHSLKPETENLQTTNLERDKQDLPQLNKPLIDKIMKYFGFTEGSNYDKMRECKDFLRCMEIGGKVKYFEEQMDAYFEFKTITNGLPFIHIFKNFLGTPGALYTDGAWNEANWVNKLQTEKNKPSGKTNQSSSGRRSDRSVPTTGGYSPL